VLKDNFSHNINFINLLKNHLLYLYDSFLSRGIILKLIRIIFLFSIFVSTACSTSISKAKNSSNKIRVNRFERQEVKIHRSAIKKRNKKSDNKTDLKLKYSKKYVNFWMKYFTKKEKKRFIKHLSNASKYKELVQSIFAKHGLPQDLFYVGLIESGYNSKIKSRSAAVGPWQFIKGTAKIYGLKVNRYVDERMNIYKSTEAAAQYFKDLYNIFGSWDLALCAYNKGEYGIIRAIRKGNTRDYQELIRKKLIPKETQYYIPKVVAARSLYINSSKHKLFYDRPSSHDYNNGSAVKLRQNFRVSTIASKLGIPKRLVLKLNPDLQRDYVKVGRSGLKVFLPKEKSSNYYLSKIKNTKVRKQVTTNNVRKHRVRRGETLSSISKKYNITINHLKKYNSLKNSKIKIGQYLNLQMKSNVYIVKSGDNLGKIASRFGLSVAKLAKYNSLNSYRIYPRQKIYIPI